MQKFCRLAVASLLLVFSPSLLTASPQAVVNPAQPYAEYKVLSGLKQPFNDDLHYHLSKGWQPVGGVSIANWNNGLYFAQLIARPANVSP